MAALDGIVVLDLGQIYNGPYATFLMAMAGARVIKIEPPGGESLRGRGEEDPASYAFFALNQGKESVTLNLKSDEGKALFRDMVKKADVVLENFGPDAMERLGLSATSLMAINPCLIYAAGSGYGREGEHRDYLAMDVTVQAMAGVMSVTGLDGMPPLKAGPAVCDFFGGVHLYGAIVTKLFERERTGEGGYVDLAMQDATVPTLSTYIGAYYRLGQTLPPRRGNTHPAGSVAPFNVYPATDGFIAIICTRDGHWESLARLMGRDELLEREDLKTRAQRGANAEEVDAVVNAWSSQLSKQELLELLQREGIPSAIVRNVEEILEDSHLHGRGMLHPGTHSVFGDVILPNSPINVATGNAIKPTPAPALGAHNEQVLTDLLGLDAEAVKRLASDGVIGGS